MTLHEGHRGRMRARYREEGLEGFAPHEVLELLLFYGRARGDVNPLAHQLLDAFGSLKGVLEARPEQLMSVKGVGEETATLISLMLPMFRRYSECICEEKKSIKNRKEAENYCKSLLAGQRSECFYMLCLGADHKLLGRRLIAQGTLMEVAAYPRIVAETALNYNAHSVVLCHNHPSGICLPSEDDLATTGRLIKLLRGLDIMVLDHIIVAGESVYSMVQMGDIVHDVPGRTTLIPADGKSHLLPTNRKKNTK